MATPLNDRGRCSGPPGRTILSRQSEAIERLLLRVPNRRRVFEAVVAFPGTHARLLSRELGMALGVVEHHVRHLEKHDLVFAHRHGRRRTLYAAGRIDPEDARVLHVLRKPVWGQLLQALLEQDQGVSELAAGVGLAPATVSYHLRRLRADGLLEHLRAGREAAYIVRDPVRIGRLLATWCPQPSAAGHAALVARRVDAAPIPGPPGPPDDVSWTGLVRRAQHYAAMRGRAGVAPLLASTQD